MPNKFTARHEPPIESALVRTIFFGGHEDEVRMWKVMDQFSETGALPSASYGLLMIGVNAMVYHHSTSEDEKGQRSVVCSVPGSPFVFVCDEAAIKAKPFGQQSHDYFLMKMRQQGFTPCGACGGTGYISQSDKLRPWLPSMGECMTCEGRGFVPIQPNAGPDAPAAPETKAVTMDEVMMSDPALKGKIDRLMAETGSSADECKVALMTWGGDYDRALKWMDESRLHFDLKGHAPDCPGRPSGPMPGTCSATCPQFKEPS